MTIAPSSAAPAADGLLASLDPEQFVSEWRPRAWRGWPAEARLGLTTEEGSPQPSAVSSIKVVGDNARMATELRDYRIDGGHLDDFVDAWRRGVRPLRVRAGFRIDGAWIIQSEPRFIWLLSLDGSWHEFELRNQAYYASAERRALDPDPAQWIVSTAHHRLRPVA